MDICNLTYLGPFGQLRAAKRTWDVGVAQQLPRHIAEKIVRTYLMAEWKLEDVVEEVVCEEPEPEEEVEQEPEVEPEKPKRKSKRTKTRAKSEPEAEEPTPEPFGEGSPVTELNEEGE